MGYQITLSSSVRRDLRDIVRYISLDSPDRAVRFGRLLVSSTKQLTVFPEMGRMVPEFRDPSIREIVFTLIGSFTASITVVAEWMCPGSGTRREAHLKSNSVPD
jgi:plasmid stabilization system protein ParE